MRKEILVITGIVLLISAVTIQAEVISNSMVVDDIEYYIQTDDSVYNLGEDIETLFRVTNLGDEEWRIAWFFPILDFIAEEKDGDNFNEIWNWSWDKVHPMGSIVVTLGPQESVEFDEIWPQIDLNGPGIEDNTQVPPGVYRISGVCYPTDIRVAVDITIIPEPGSLALFVGGMFVLIRKRKN